MRGILRQGGYGDLVGWNVLVVKREEKRRPVVEFEQNTGFLDEKIELILEFFWQKKFTPDG